jgi:hypothetical protein
MQNPLPNKAAELAEEIKDLAEDIAICFENGDLPSHVELKIVRDLEGKWTVETRSNTVAQGQHVTVGTGKLLSEAWFDESDFVGSGYGHVGE